MLQGSPIRRRKLYEEVAERLAKAIADGNLQAGQPLPSEREIMDAFNVGRTAVREALFALQTDGLIQLANGKRPVVVEPTKSIMDKLANPSRHLLGQPGRLRQLQEARTLLEAALARHAARAATASEIAAIGAALKKNKAALGDAEAFVRTNIEFHLEIARVSSNFFVESLHTAVNDWLEEHRKVAITRSGAAELAFQRHEQIFDAIRRGDCDAAEEAMQTHLRESQDAYWVALEQKTSG